MNNDSNKIAWLNGLHQAAHAAGLECVSVPGEEDLFRLRDRRSGALLKPDTPMCAREVIEECRLRA